MTRILMIVYGITAEQAAARAPAAQFAVTSVIAALFVWLDSMGRFDDVGRWMGRKLREVLDALSQNHQHWRPTGFSNRGYDYSL